MCSPKRVQTFQGKLKQPRRQTKVRKSFCCKKMRLYMKWLNNQENTHTMSALVPATRQFHKIDLVNRRIRQLPHELTNGSMSSKQLQTTDGYIFVILIGEISSLVAASLRKLSKNKGLCCLFDEFQMGCCTLSLFLIAML